MHNAAPRQHEHLGARSQDLQILVLNLNINHQRAHSGMRRPRSLSGWSPVMISHSTTP